MIILPQSTFEQLTHLTLSVHCTGTLSTLPQELHLSKVVTCMKMCIRMKRSFYRAVNGIFAKLGRLAPEEIILQLICKKWMPILLCGLEVCLLSKRQLMSLDFTVNRVLMNQNIHIDIIQDCRDVLSLNYPVYSW